MGPHATAFIFYGVSWSTEQYHVDTLALEYEIEKQLEELGLIIEECGNSYYATYNHLYVTQIINLSAMDYDKPTQFDPNSIYAVPQDQCENILKNINQALQLLKVPQNVQEKLSLGWHLAAHLEG